jgi:hypothetical protein
LWRVNDVTQRVKTLKTLHKRGRKAAGAFVGDHDGFRRGRCAVTEGFAIGFGWLMLFALLGLLAYFILRKPR